MTKFVRNLALAGILLILAAGGVLFLIYGNRDGTVSIHISQAMIDGALTKKFPKEKVYAKIIRVTYAKPHTAMVPEQEKLRVGLEVQVEIGIKGLAKTFHGGAEITTRVGYDPAKYQFILREAQLESLDIPKLPAKDLAKIKEGVNLIVGEFFDDIPVYKLTKADTKTQLTKLLLKDLSIQRDQVVATLGAY